MTDKQKEMILDVVAKTYRKGYLDALAAVKEDLLELIKEERPEELSNAVKAVLFEAQEAADERRDEYRKRLEDLQ